MKYLKSYLTALLTVVLFTGSLMANGVEPVKNAKAEMRSEIVKMIDAPKLEKEDQGVAQIQFLVTSDNEIVILTVDASNSFIDTYVKSKLNYKKLKTDGIKPNSKFNLKLTFQK